MKKLFPTRMRGVFIHNVNEVPKKEGRKLSQKGVWDFDNDIDAARIALREGLISKTEAKAIGAAAIREFYDIDFKDTNQRNKILKELRVSQRCLRDFITQLKPASSSKSDS